MNKFRYHVPFTLSLSMKVSVLAPSRKPCFSYRATASGEASRKASTPSRSACCVAQRIICKPAPFPWKAGDVATISRSAQVFSVRSPVYVHRLAIKSTTHTNALSPPSTPGASLPTSQKSRCITLHQLLQATVVAPPKALRRAWAAAT